MRLFTFLNRTPLINILVFGLGFLLIIMHIFKNKTKHVESFTQEEKYVIKSNKDLYDDFYVDVYEYVVFDPNKTYYEISEIDKIVKFKKGHSVLDVGSGLGYHVDALTDRGIDVIGLENSKAMINKSKKNFPKIDVRYGNVMDSMIFEGNDFTHILCMFYTFYYIPDQEAFLRNAYKWLRHNGYLIIHVVDREKFHPIVPPSEIFTIPTQYLAKKGTRITNSYVKFEGFDYKANFIEKFNKNKAEFIEEFTNDDTKNTRKNVHKLNMMSLEEYKKLFKKCRFSEKAVIDLSPVKYEYQYIYILQKTD